MKNGFSTPSIIAIILVIGFFTLAIIDKNYRPGFVGLANVGVGGFLGLNIPRQLASRIKD